jgi:hypothetical protein
VVLPQARTAVEDCDCCCCCGYCTADNTAPAYRSVLLFADAATKPLHLLWLLLLLLLLLQQLM